MTLYPNLEKTFPSQLLHALSDSRRQAHRLSFFDPLTDLPNRKSFGRAIERLTRSKQSRLGLLLIDIDDLKRANDTKGHAVGDQIICDVASRLQALEHEGYVFRLSSDEFAIICVGCCDHSDLRASASDVLARMSARREEGDGVPRVSIGGALFGVDGHGACSLRQNADLALQHAKLSNRGAYEPFNPDLRKALVRKAEVLRTVETALDEERLTVFYQPLVRLDTQQTIGFEALARVVADDGMVVTAGNFQEAFAEPSLANRMTRHMLAQVARDLRGWLDDGLAFNHVGINLTASDFERENVEALIMEAFHSAKVPLSHLVLEVTEAVFMDGLSKGIIEAIQRLRKRGLLIALDDFGTGFASLTHLRTFPVDIIKIDKSFIDRLLTDLPSEVIVEALIRIGRRLDIRIVAEGIETIEQAGRLREMGCVLGQGYLFGRPAAAGSTHKQLAEALPFGPSNILR